MAKNKKKEFFDLVDKMEKQIADICHKVDCNEISLDDAKRQIKNVVEIFK